ncbi:MAG TPA: ThuA domain-containing protein [Trebonia sp.]
MIIITGDDVYEDLFSAGVKLAEILSAAGYTARCAMGTARLADSAADLVVLYSALGSFPPGTQAALDSAVRSGTGLLAVHASNVFPGDQFGPHPGYETARQLIGSRFESHGPPPHESTFTVETDQGHPVTRGIGPFPVRHEHYHLELAADAREVAWRRTPDGREPIAYVRQHDRGRVCYLQLGHDMRSWDDPPVREIVTNAARWASRPRGTAQ